MLKGSQSIFGYSLACLLVTLSLLGGMACEAHAAETKFSVEVVSTSRFAMAGAQKWAKELGELGFSNVRIRLAGESERLVPEVTGNTGDAHRKVVGLLTSGDILVFPGAKFRRGDGVAIQAWLKDIAGGTSEAEPPSAFDLSAEELIDVHTELAQTVRVTTQGKTVTATANAIVRELTTPISVSDAVKARLASADPVRDELQGLSAGTALAAVLRPLGLGLAPVKREGQLVLKVDDFRKLPESWPIGWPPQEKDSEVVPKLMDFLPVEIKNTPIADTVAAIAGRLELPVLYDHNGMARHRIDPWTDTSSLPETRTYYRRVLDRTLIPAGLKAEVRLDEAEKPFLWIGTLKQ